MPKLVEMKALEFIAWGRVQGVFFRARVKELAEKLGVQGTVENLADGSVRIRAQAALERLEEFEAALNIKSDSVWVEGLNKRELAEKRTFNGFKIIY